MPMRGKSTDSLLDRLDRQMEEFNVSSTYYARVLIILTIVLVVVNMPLTVQALLNLHMLGQHSVIDNLDYYVTSILTIILVGALLYFIFFWKRKRRG